MPFERPTIDTIYNRMKTDFEYRFGVSNILSRSLEAVLLTVFAGAIYLVYGFVVNLSKQMFYTKADTEWLDWHAIMWGLPRKAARKADGTVRFFGTPTTNVPLGTEVETDVGIVFVTTVDDDIEAGGYVDIAIEADEAGDDGNVTDATMSLVTPISGVNSEVTVITAPTGGTDTETNTALVARLKQRTQNPPGSGNRGDYERWALEVTGVGRAWVKIAEEWAGSGTVGVIVATDTLEAVSPAILSDVETYIEAERPVGALATYSNPSPKDVTFDISITPNTATYQTLIDTKLQELFILSSEPGGTLYLSQIRQAIASSGVTNYEITDITYDGSSIGVVDIEATGLELPRFTSATYSAL